MALPLRPLGYAGDRRRLAGGMHEDMGRCRRNILNGTDSRA